MELKQILAWEDFGTDTMNIVSTFVWKLEEYHKSVYLVLAVMFIVLLVLDMRQSSQVGNRRAVEEDIRASVSGQPKLSCDKTR